MPGEYLNQRPDEVPPHAFPEVQGPNPFPSGLSFDTTTENYADGFPPTPTVTYSAIRARERLSCVSTRGKSPGARVDTILSPETLARLEAEIARHL